MFALDKTQPMVYYVRVKKEVYMIEKLRMLTLEKIRFINKDIEENIVLDNHVSVLELYKQKRLIVKLYKKYKVELDKIQTLSYT